VLVKNQCKYSKCSWFMISMPKMPCLWIYDDKSNSYLSGKSGKKAIYIKNKSGKKAISMMFMILLKCHHTNASVWGSYLTESWGFKLTSFIITINLAGNTYLKVLTWITLCWIEKLPYTLLLMGMFPCDFDYHNLYTSRRIVRHMLWCFEGLERTWVLALEFIVLFSSFRFHLSFPIEIALLFLIFFPLLSQLRRERIAERIRALQELVPSVNKVSVFPLA